MPPGVMADWNSFAYHYALNAYYFAALREVGAALSDLSTPVAADVRRLTESRTRARSPP